jgi:ferritin
MQLPTVNMNGTSGKELFETNLAAVEKLRDAIDALAKACPNGRDYQTLGREAMKRAVEEHGQRMERLKYVLAELETITESLADFA